MSDCNVKFGFKWYLLRWLRGPAYLAQGFAQTVSFGFYEPDWALKADSAFLDSACEN